MCIRDRRQPLGAQLSDLVPLGIGQLRGSLRARAAPGQPNGAIRLVLGPPDDHGVLAHTEHPRHLALAGRLRLDQLHRCQSPRHQVPRGPAPRRHPPQEHRSATLVVLHERHTVGHSKRPSRGQRKRRHRIQCARCQHHPVTSPKRSLLQGDYLTPPPPPGGYPLLTATTASLCQEVWILLPQVRFELADLRKAKVGPNYHVQVEKNFYSVPSQLIGRQVDVRITSHTVEVFDSTDRVASHARFVGVTNRYATVPMHMPEAHRSRLVDWSPERFGQWASTVGPNTVAAITPRHDR